jgi:hypothetical protein
VFGCGALQVESQRAEGLAWLPQLSIEFEFQRAQQAAQLPRHDAPASVHGRGTMSAENAPAVDRLELRRGLVTSSTKRRISELSALQHQLQDQGELAMCANRSLPLTPRSNTPRRPALPGEPPLRNLPPLQ